MFNSEKTRAAVQLYTRVVNLSQTLYTLQGNKKKKHITTDDKLGTEHKLITLFYVSSSVFWIMIFNRREKINGLFLCWVVAKKSKTNPVCCFEMTALQSMKIVPVIMLLLSCNMNKMGSCCNSTFFL